MRKRFRNFERAAGRLFGAVAEDQCHPVAGRQPDDFFVARIAHLRGLEHDLGELAETLLLLLNQEFGIPDNVDEENVADLELQIRFIVGGHGPENPHYWFETQTF